MIIFNVIGKKHNQTSVFNTDREIPTLGNLVKLVSSIIHLPSAWDFLVCIGDRCYILSCTLLQNRGNARKLYKSLHNCQGQKFTSLPLMLTLTIEKQYLCLAFCYYLQMKQKLKNLNTIGWHWYSYFWFYIFLILPLIFVGRTGSCRRLFYWVSLHL